MIRGDMSPLRNLMYTWGMNKNMLRYVTIAVLLLSLSGCHARPPSGAKEIRRELVATGYCKCKKCCGWKRTWYGKPVVASGPQKGKRKKVGVTASGAKAKYGTIAADTGLYPFGTVMQIPGYGWGKVEDRGGAIKGHHVDLFFKSHGKALKWGKQRKTVRIWISPKK
jgi:3D (Asp-Asp-Asp) domain-containing protein